MGWAAQAGPDGQLAPALAQPWVSAPGRVEAWRRLESPGGPSPCIKWGCQHLFLPGLASLPLRPCFGCKALALSRSPCARAHESHCHALPMFCKGHPPLCPVLRDAEVPMT